MPELIFATNNPNKLTEVRHLAPKNYKIVSLEEIKCFDELPETHETLEENALEKAMYVVDNFHVDCFSEDTGLEVISLNGEPGVYSARYAGPQRDSKDNMKLLLKKLMGKSERQAQFCTVIALIMKGNQYTFEGIVRGSIAMTPKGGDGFGYDPIFIPEGSDKTFAEMTMEKKSQISHRKRALDKLIDFLNNC